MATARAKVTTWAMAMVTRLMGNKEGKGEGGKGKAMRGAGIKQGECGKAMAMVQGLQASGRQQRRQG